MTSKQIIINDIDVSECEYYDKNKPLLTCVCEEYPCSECPNCHYKKWKRKEQEYEELRQYHNKCCEEFEKEKKEWLEKYNQVSRDFYDGKYCDKEHCSLLQAKEEECEKLKDIANRALDKLNKYLDKQVQLDQLKQTLIKTKKVLQFYNNTTIGTDKGNGVFEFEVFNDNVLGGKLICYYNTNPAKEALQKINEVIPDEN